MLGYHKRFSLSRFLPAGKAWRFSVGGLFLLDSVGGHKVLLVPDVSIRVSGLGLLC